MHIRLATSDNDSRIKEFFEKQSIQGDLKYQVLRPNGFFEHAKQNFQEYKTLILEDEKEISGCLSINAREALIQNEWKKVGWATDLRVANNRKSMLYWFDHFLEEIKRVRKEGDLDHVFSFINKSNQSAFNTFIRPKALRPHHPRFHLLTNFYRISVYSRIAIFPSPIRTLRIRSLDDSNMDALADYLQKSSKNRFFSYRYTTDLIKSRIQKWQNFSKENFLIAFDAKGNIVGCLALWNAFNTQKYKVLNYNDFYENMRQLTRISSFFGLTKNMPAPNDICDFYFLTHLRANNHYIFHRLLYEALQFCNPEQYLVYSSFEGDRTFKPPKDMLHTKSKFGLYLVLSPNEPLPFSHLSHDSIPDFEIAYL